MILPLLNLDIMIAAAQAAPRGSALLSRHSVGRSVGRSGVLPSGVARNQLLTRAG